jgi:membrane protease subunit HflC
MPRTIVFVLITVFLALMLAINSVFIVRQDRQAIVLRFREYNRVINAPGTEQPGAYFKIPFVDEVVDFDRKIIGLTLVGQEIAASNQQYLVVDAVVRWRIEDPRLFYRAALTEAVGASRLEAFAKSAMGRALGSATSDDIISGRRAELMQVIESDLNAAAATALGVRVIDVRIRQVDLPQAAQERVFVRMRSEREQVAGRIRAEGSRAAVVIQATAQGDAERTRGEGDAERARIFARAYGRDPEFAAFYRSMRAYETALDAGTPIIVPPDSDFFRYMQRRNGAR